MHDYDADLQIVVAFRILPKIIFTMPKYGSINLHASLLPDYRGAAPINWVLINGEKTTGITTFFINEKIDNIDCFGIANGSALCDNCEICNGG